MLGQFCAHEIIRRYYGQQKTVHVHFDQNPDAKGFEILTAFELIKDLGHLSNLVRVQPTSWKIDPLFELADLYAYWMHREKHIEYIQGSDPLMDQFSLQFPLPQKEIPVLTELEGLRITRLLYVAAF